MVGVVLGGFLFVSCYLTTAIGYTGGNVHHLNPLGQALRVMGRFFIIGGDFKLDR